ncbi:hypothetical protein O6H91_Y429500 [Diphasiastrum complanatum]|nr:hypothetical protein O6H91_Y429500 [Diphasiastrum complanatum]
MVSDNTLTISIGCGLAESPSLENSRTRRGDPSVTGIWTGVQCLAVSFSTFISDACNNPELPNLDYALLAGCDVTDVIEDSGGAEMEAVAAKELEHNLLQDSLDKELQELNRRLELKEAEMKSFARPDTAVLKQHFEKKLTELEEEKKALQRERDILLMELEALASTSDEQTQKMQEAHRQKLKELEHQIAELRKKQDNQAQLLKQKQRSDEAAKRLQDDILRIKQHKVQLQNKIKQESEQFRSWKALREKEIVQLKKEGRRNEYEMHKLQALHQRQKMVLQRKTEEAAMATRRLKEVLEARKSAPRENVLQGAASAHGLNLSNEKALQQWLDHELEVAVRVHEVRMAYEKQCDSRSALANELANLKQDELRQKDSGTTLTSDQDGTPASMGMRRSTSMSPPARHARIALLESMLNASSSALVAMASQLSEAEERERVVSGRARWQQLRSMGDAKNLLNVMFSNAVSARCELRDKEVELKEIKERVTELDEALKQSESLRLEIEKQQRLKEKAVDVALATVTKAGVDAAVKRGVEELSLGLSQLTGLGPRHLQNADDSSELTNPDTSGFPYALRQAARDFQSQKSTDTEESDSSEWEIDMDLDDSDQSDKDWEEDDERFAVKGRGITRGGRKQERKISSGSSNAQSDHGFMEERQCVGSKAKFFSDEGAFEETEPMSRLSFDGCCSCGQSSGCKTKKCECKAAGSFCGHKCGCKSTKCANRENFEFDTQSFTRTFATDVRTTDGMENTRSSNLNEGDQDTNGLPTAGQHTGGNSNKLIQDVIHEEQSMARHGARLLESAWQEELDDAYLPSDRETGDEQPKVDDTSKPMQRRPLSDIGNRKGSSKYQTESKQKRKLPRALIQIVPSRQSTNIPRSDYAENQPVAVPPPTTNAVSTSNNSGTTVVGSSDVLADANLKADTSVPNIRLQNIERKRSVGSRQSQKGGNIDDNGINRRFASGVNSPDKPARRIIDKENMR